MILSKRIDKIIIFTTINSFVYLINLWGIGGPMNLKGNSATKLFVQPTVWKGCWIRGRKRFCLQYNYCVKRLGALAQRIPTKGFSIESGSLTKTLLGLAGPPIGANWVNMVLLSYNQAIQVNYIVSLAVPQ